MEETMKKSKNKIWIFGMLFGALAILGGITSFSNGVLEALKSILIGAVIFVPSYLIYKRNKATQDPNSNSNQNSKRRGSTEMKVADGENTHRTFTIEERKRTSKKPAAAKIPYRKRRKPMDDYVVFDLETTGFQPTNSEIIEIGAIRYKNNEEVDRFHTYVKPSGHILSRITKINGIDDSMVKDAPSVDEALPAFLNFAGKETLIAHNASFDMSFVLHYHGDEIPNYVSDTLSLSRNTFDHRYNKLTDWKERLGLDHLGSHNSIDDCIVCHELYQHVKNNSNLK
jgi:DNA polymerase-3 subunit epsilon